MSDLFIVTLDARWMREICFLGSMCSAKMVQNFLMPQLYFDPERSEGPMATWKRSTAETSHEARCAVQFHKDLPTTSFVQIRAIRMLTRRLCSPHQSTEQTPGAGKSGHALCEEPKVVPTKWQQEELRSSRRRGIALVAMRFRFPRQTEQLGLQGEARLAKPLGSLLILLMSPPVSHIHIADPENITDCTKHVFHFAPIRRDTSGVDQLVRRSTASSSRLRRTLGGEMDLPTNLNLTGSVEDLRNIFRREEVFGFHQPAIELEHAATNFLMPTSAATPITKALLGRVSRSMPPEELPAKRFLHPSLHRFNYFLADHICRRQWTRGYCKKYCHASRHGYFTP